MEIPNAVTGSTTPVLNAIDYVVLKVPRGPFDKFALGISTLAQMKATGEVMAIDR